MLLAIASTETTSTTLLMMDSRDAPSLEAHPRVKTLSGAESSAAPVIVLAGLPAPTEAELLRHSLDSSPQREQLSFGRVPTELGINGLVEVPANVSAVRVQLSSATALHLRSAWRFAGDGEYAVTYLPAAIARNH
jgi:hypothetical protein